MECPLFIYLTKDCEIPECARMGGGEMIWVDEYVCTVYV